MTTEICDLATWEEQGYLLKRRLFDADEMRLLLHSGRNDERHRNDA